jgi:glutathionyl-hydroquinone reductase
MEALLEKMTARLAASWTRRHELARRLKEDDGFITVEVVLWVLGLSGLAITVGAIINALVIAKAKSIHF